MTIDELVEAIRANRVWITDHADEEAAADGQTFTGEPIHSVWAYKEQNGGAILITVYRPDPDRWINWRERRKGR